MLLKSENITTRNSGTNWLFYFGLNFSAVLLLWYKSRTNNKEMLVQNTNTVFTLPRSWPGAPRPSDHRRRRSSKAAEDQRLRGKTLAGGAGGWPGHGPRNMTSDWPGCQASLASLFVAFKKRKSISMMRIHEKNQFMNLPITKPDSDNFLFKIQSVTDFPDFLWGRFWIL